MITTGSACECSGLWHDDLAWSSHDESCWDKGRRGLVLLTAGPSGMQGQQWVRMVVLGQSFMLHQIRKLVGMAVGVMRGIAPPDAISRALDPARTVTTPMAPELGLFLDECVFESYNDRWGNDREACVRLAAFQDQVDAFKVRNNFLVLSGNAWRCSSERETGNMVHAEIVWDMQQRLVQRARVCRMYR